MIEIDKGDYLTFAAMGAAFGLKTGDWKACEISSGIYRRHPDLQESESRSDISRDGYLGTLLYSVVMMDKSRINRVIAAIIKTGGTVGERGNWDYVNMLPLLPLYLAARFKLIPFLPIFVPEAFETGFRAHLLAVTIMIELESGCSGWTSRKAIRKLVEKNPENPLFLSILNRMTGESQDKALELLRVTPIEESPHGWGSCPYEVFAALTKHNIC